MLSRRPVGNTGMEVSVLGLGTVKLGRDQGVKYPRAFKIPDDRAASNLLALARDHGVNLIDTAPAYGNSEERLGHLLVGQRQHWMICTKVGEEFVDGGSHFDFSATYTRRSIERSLARLRTSVLDIVLIHSNGDDEYILREGEALDTLQRLKAEGKIRAIGMSTKTVAGGLLAAEQCDVVMVTWNLAQREEIPVVDRCRALGRGVLIKKALASGHQVTSGSGVRLEEGDPVKRSFEEILAHPGVSSIIAGTINPIHLQANIRAAARVCLD